nr:MAG TPA: hypothetical protein [Caudoviricetes sp.]
MVKLITILILMTGQKRLMEHHLFLMVQMEM